MKVIEREIGLVKPYEKNPRIIPEEAVERVAASIREFGFQQPIVVDKDGVIIVGHTRLKAAEKLGLEKVPVVVADLSPEKARAYRLADNKTNEATSWDDDLLFSELTDIEADIADLDFSMLDFGFSALDLGSGDFGIGEPFEDDFDGEVPKDTDIKEGDMFQLGEHVLMCGDSTSKDDVKKLLGGGTVKADMVFTDPPYGMKKENEAGGVMNDNQNNEELLLFNKRWIPLSFAALKDNGSWYCWGIDEPLMDVYGAILRPMIKERKICFRNLLTWDKGSGQGQMSQEHRSYARADEKCLFVMCGSDAMQGFSVNADDYSENMEPIRLYIKGELDKLGLSYDEIGRRLGFTGRAVGHWISKSQFYLPTRENYEALKNLGREVLGKKDYDFLKKNYDELKKDFYAGRSFFDNTHDNMNNVWHFSPASQKEREQTGDHPTIKPIALCTRAIKSSSRDGEIVLDLFGGSGTTLIACEQLGRKCRMMELDPHYCQVIIERWQALTGQMAVKIA